ncbi:MAG: HAD family hydrolase [Acidobacteria bacterium]|nr:HAD family hydrolase [Acidobacteriota bacterium]
MSRGPHRAVLFDFFDTLCRIDEDLYHRGKKREADLLGVDAEAFLTAWMDAADAAQVGSLPDLEARTRHAAAALGIDPSADTLGAVVALEEETLRCSTSLYPDVLPTLETLRAVDGIGLALVSNASSPAAKLYECLGLTPYFDPVVFSFRIGVIKPDPGIYLEACRLLGVPPAACLFVGDGNGRELDGAKRVGMEAVRIERPVSIGRYRKEESVEFDVSVDTLTRIPSLLRL